MTPRPPPNPKEAYKALVRARDRGRVTLLVNAQALNHPGSLVFSPLDVFVPPLVLLASSLTFLFCFGLLPWLAALVVVLAYQFTLAPRLVAWRLRQRVIKAAFSNERAFLLLWKAGGIALALADWPERNCPAPAGDWRKFVADYLVEIDSGEAN